MNIQETRDQVLNEKLTSLCRKLAVVATQTKLRKEVLPVGELDAIKEALYPPNSESDPEAISLQFKRQFDSNWQGNLQFLAKYRQVGDERLVLDLAVELGFLTEPDYQRYVRQIDSDSAVRPSVLLHYNEGNLYLRATKIGCVQQRPIPTNLETVLQTFQEQNWPNSISAPTQWDEEKVKRVCYQLRQKFDGHVSFHQSNGARSIRWELCDS